MESDDTRRVCREAEKCGAMTFPIIGGPDRPVGWPDRIFIWRGFAFFVEFKGLATRLGKAQQLIIKKIRERRVPACIARHYANTLEDESGEIIGHWDGTGRGLLFALLELYNDK